MSDATMPAVTVASIKQMYDDGEEPDDFGTMRALCDSHEGLRAERDAALADLEAERRERDADCYEYAATIERAERAEADLEAMRAADMEPMSARVIVQLRADLEAARVELHTEQVCFADSRATFQGELEAARIGRQAQQEHDAEMLRRKQRDLEAAREALRALLDEYTETVDGEWGMANGATVLETPAAVAARAALGES